MNISRYTKILHSNSFQPEELRLTLVLYWRMLLGSVLTIIIIVFAYGGWQLFEVMENADILSSDVSADSHNAPIKNEDVNALVKAISSRQEHFDRSTPDVATDPAR
ncbi:hypothetical protein FJY93_00870 [Candidatus Kaiserbacteria bacterium]|nr:hypothetical protein [Candidatus Kaiserbacteria bacterium]